MSGDGRRVRLPRSGLRRRLRAVALAVVLVVATVTGAVATEEQAAILAGIALKIFPRIVAVDTGLGGKLSSEGRVRLLLFFESDRSAAERYAARLGADVARIHEWPVEIVVAGVEALAALARPPSAILLVEPLADATFEVVTRYGREHARMVFSPFRGDVARGAAAGLHVGVRVLPAFNRAALDAAGLVIDPQVLKISEIHE